MAGPLTQVLVAEDLSKSYGPVTALHPLDLAVRSGEGVAIVGRSGAGKSTLLHLLAAMDRPTGGTVRFAGEDLSGRNDEGLAALRRQHFGFVFQSGRLIPYLSAVENVALPLLLADVDRRTATGTALELLDGLGIGALASRLPTQMSGGEAQRVAIARAVAADPDVVFADEPTGNLDSANAEVALELLLRASAGRALVLVTHDEQIAQTLPRRVELHDGRLTADSASVHR